MRPDKAYILALTETRAATPTADPLVWEKEFAYAGHFEKGDLAFSIDKDLMEHWVRTFRDFSADGVKVPVPVQHSVDPEANRGMVLSMRTGKDDKGRDAVFAMIRFNDAEAAKLAKSTDVSLYCPVEHKLGNGKTYKRPIVHIALTDYPTIPGLNSFRAIVASLTETDMTFLELVAELEIEVPEDATEEMALEALKAYIAELRDKVTAAEEAQAQAVGASTVKRKTTVEETPIAASLVGMCKELRTNKIDGLVKEGKMTPAVAKTMKEKYCSDQQATLVLSHGGSDDFDSVVAMFSANDPVASPTPKAGLQATKQAGPGVLEKDAERRKNA